MSNILKKILNTSEFLTKNLIEKSLDHNQFYLLSQTAMNKVINADAIELTKRERQHYNDTTFDFIIVNNEGFASLVIEFDGPEHFTNPSQKRADLTKSKICYRAHLPILRIDDTYLEDNAKLSILEFVLSRFNKWNIEKDELRADFAYYINNLTDEERKISIEEMDYLDYTPETNFNYKYHLTRITGIFTEIEKNIGIYSENYFDENNTHKSFYGYRGGTPIYLEDGNFSFDAKYQLTAYAQKESAQIVIDEIISEIATMRWYLFEEKTKDGNIYRNETIHFDIPGTSIPDLCENIAHYKCLKRIRDKCKEYIDNGWLFV